MVLWLCFYLQRLWEVARFIGLGSRIWDWWKGAFRVVASGCRLSSG